MTRWKISAASVCFQRDSFFYALFGDLIFFPWQQSTVRCLKKTQDFCGARGGKMRRQKTTICNALLIIGNFHINYIDFWLLIPSKRLFSYPLCDLRLIWKQKPSIVRFFLFLFIKRVLPRSCDLLYRRCCFFFKTIKVLIRHLIGNPFGMRSLNFADGKISSIILSKRMR